MAYEAFQWATIAALALLLLGVLRQVSLLLPPSERAVPHGGPPLGTRVPRRLLSRVRATIPDNVCHREAELLVVFVTEGCAGCQRLLADVGARYRADDGCRDGRQLVLVAHRPSQQFRKALAGLGVPSIYDEDGDLWRAFSVTETPLVMRIGRDGRVQAREVTHRVDVVTAD